MDDAFPYDDPGELSLMAGALPLTDGSTRFRVWAPRAAQVALRIVGPEERNVPMAGIGEGVYETVVPYVPPGTDYAYILDDGPPLPDPVSRFQPFGVHGSSQVVDPRAFAWEDGPWRGLPLEQLVVYELHTGTFTEQGTFRGIADRLEHLRSLGVTAIELMPVAEFPGDRNWGYDGVHPYAVQSSYGGPEELKALVNACHQAGLAVILDVVYNHLGPEGNYLHAYGPYFSDRYRTPWGDALNFDGADSDPVRRYFIDNALYWLTEYHLDGLRLDAVHGIFDFSARHILAELSAAFHGQAARLGRQAWLIAESDLNDARVISPAAMGGWGMNAQWNDDFHHALHALLTGNRKGYFGDFGRVTDLCKALESGYVYNGRYSRYRRRRHGNSPAGREGRQFVVFTQNHDQIANACNGRRLGDLTSPEQERLATALMVCAPNLPMLFMGQEYGEIAPFHYFTSHDDPGLARAVTEGRRGEHAAFHKKEAFLDPQAPAAFEASKLDWSRCDSEPHMDLFRFYRALLALRRENPCLHYCRKDRTRATGHESRRWMVVEREGINGPGAMLFCNFNAQPRNIPLPRSGAAWQLALWSGAPQFGGRKDAPPPPERLVPRDPEEETIVLEGWGAALYLWREAP